MRKLSVLALAVFLTALLITNVFASNGTQVGTVGARSTAMGSCFRGLADDWSAVFFNPAGLTKLGRLTFGGSVGLIMASGSYTQEAYPTAYTVVPPYAGMYTDQRDLVDKTFYVPALAAIFKPNEKLALGLAFYAPFGLGTEYDLLFVPDAFGNPTALPKENEHYSDHQVINIQPTMAYQVSEKVSFGLGVSYIWGKMDLRKVALPFHPLFQQRIIVENDMKGSGSTFGFNAGLLVDFSEKFSLGLSGRYALDLKLTGDFTQNIYTLFAIADQEIEYTVEEAKLPLPWTVGAGIAFKPSPKLTLTADVSITNWESWGDIEIKVEELDEPVTLKENWSNTIEMGFGFEFRALDKETSKFFVRGGFYTVDSPVPDETMDPTILDPCRRYVITGGLGLDLGKVAFNLAGEYILFGEKTVDEYEFTPLEEGAVAENYAGLYKFSAMVFTLGTSINLN